LNSNQKQLKILSVEDDNIIGEMLVIMLEDMGYEAISVENGDEGLEVYNEAVQSNTPFGLVISDLGMEGIDGITFSKELKKITPDIPIILLTGFSTLVKQEDFEVVNCMLRKPVVIDELKNAIAKILDGSSSNS
jgi:two-component system cell cycle sensor histidine kinase/response regulator CckA